MSCLSCFVVVFLAVALLHLSGCSAAIEPFPLTEVRLLNTSIQSRYERLNQKYLLDMLDPDSLLWSFRKTAGLPTPGKPYVGSWEDPNCELRGHFVGHVLSALSLAWAATGNQAFLTRLTLMVGELHKVQEAMGLGGYLSAFPPTWFDKLEALQFVWAPYYTIHKILAGLVDAYELGGQAVALDMARGVAAYHWNRTQAVVAAKGMKYWQDVLENEFGGMNEILYRMYGITKDPDHLAFAQHFDKRLFVEAMASNQDVLDDLHANTHMAQVVGFIAGYEETRDEKLRVAVTNFFDMVNAHHGFATAGTSAFERWQKPDTLGRALEEMPENPLMVHETCTQYNMLKIARSLFCWTGDVAYADHYERALVNGMLGTARLPPEDWAEAHSGHDHHHHHHSHRRRVAAASDDAAKAAQRAADAASHAEAVVGPFRRLHDDRWMDWIGFDRPKPEWNASDAHGPGVFLYFLSMGHGRSKSDNLHHWGFPFHSFWCCYGTIVESYAKLADSIYFKDMSPVAESKAAVPGGTTTALPPRLYVNQLVSSQLSWRELGLQLNMQADPFAPGHSTTAVITFAQLPGAAAANPYNLTFTLMVRIPSWAREGPAGVQLELNGLSYNGCPGAPTPSSYCRITRQWSVTDRVSVRIVYRWWLAPLQDSRRQYQSLAAIMMGPHVMVGITHDDHTAGLPYDMVERLRSASGIGGFNPQYEEEDGGAAAGAGAADAGVGGGDGGAGMLGLEDVGLVYPPEDADEMVSLQAGWNSSLYVRHESHLLHVSEVEDGGDALDATFRLGRGCHHGHGHGRGQGVGGVGSAEHHSTLSALHGHGDDSGDDSVLNGLHAHHTVADAYSSMHSLMRLGQHDAGQQLSLEAMAYPNHFLAHDHDGVIVMQPVVRDARRRPLHTPCAHAGWMMRPGLDGQPDTVSFEAADKPGYYITAYVADPGPCENDPEVSCGQSKTLCGHVKYTDNVLCRKTCDSCTREWGESLRLRPQEPGNTAFAAASSFRLSPPARRAYPAGSHVLAAATRHYLLAPLGNLVDERYTAYFRLMPSGTTKDMLRAREGGEERGAAEDQDEAEEEE